MFCSNCGNECMENSNFCENCGEKVDSVKKIESITQVSKQEKSTPSTSNFSQEITACEDGLYRWTYKMNMWKNPTLLITLWKVLMIGAMFPVLLMTFLTLIEEGFGDAIIILFQMLMLMGGIMTGLVIIAYPIVIIINGGSYHVVFELDENGINHIQMQKQFKKNQIVAFITVLAGASTGSPQVAGAGLLAGCKQSSYSSFKNVTKIVSKKKRHVIYVNEKLQHNQVYVDSKDFEAIENYIVSHCDKATVTKK